MTRRLTLKVTGGGQHIRVDRDIDGAVDADALEVAADAAAESLGLPKKRADRRGASARPERERFGPATTDEPEE